jgi:uncharacterized membrane protein YfcA
MEYFDKIVALLGLPAEGVALGVLAGFLTGLFGAGGGFILTPALNIFLGLPYDIAIGTSSCLVLGSSSLALYHHFDRRMHGVRIAFLTGIGIPFGSFLGVKLVEQVGQLGDLVFMGHTVPARQFLFTLIFSVFLALIASWLLLDNFYLRRGREDDHHAGYLAWIRLKPLVVCDTIPDGPFSAPVLVALGVLVGFLGGFLGVGGGVIMMPLLFYVVGQETKYAARTSTMLVFLTSLMATVLHASHGNIRYMLFLFLFGGAFGGVRIGVAVQHKLGGKSIRKYFAFVVLAAVVMVLIKLVRIIQIAPLACR